MVVRGDDQRRRRRQSVLRRRGGAIDGKTVQFVGWDRVWLASGSSVCRAEMFETDADGGPPKTAPRTTSSGAAQIAEGIVKVGPTELKIDRGVVDRLLENQAELMSQVRLVPERENGRIAGIRMVGVRPDTLLGRLGMENGDRLQTINGFGITNPEIALEAYARLRTADRRPRRRTASPSLR